MLNDDSGNEGIVNIKLTAWEILLQQNKGYRRYGSVPQPGFFVDTHADGIQALQRVKLSAS